MEEILKLGTVVKISEPEGEVMIIGYYPEDPETGNVYTYLGISPVYGISFNEDAVFFNKDRILEIVFEGYSDEVSDKFRTLISENVRNPVDIS